MIGRNRKAIAAAVAGLFGALGAGVVSDGVSVAEMFAAFGASVLGFVGVWSTAPNDPPKSKAAHA